MIELIGIIIVFAILILAVVVLRSPKRQASRSLQYFCQESLLSPAERSFFGVLASAVGGEYVVVPKTRVADALMPRKGLSRAEWQRAFNKVSSKHFDYLVCRASTFEIVAAVELDDKSHRRENRRQRDEFLAEATSSAGLPLLRFPAKEGYSLPQVRESFITAVQRFSGAA